ncbi:MAG: ABC transporter substrate-binding protein [Candidatus Lokiarchaeota archaeon]|nr:ABC transporter substrate-binding protein [Candidatus Lokiarchaeota archaeon]
MKKSVIIWGFILLCGIILGNNQYSSNYRLKVPNAMNAESITIRDMFNREVEIPFEVNRVVGTGAGALRYIVYMNGTDKVVGVENIEREEEADSAAEMRPYFFAHPELQYLPSIGEKWGGNPELIVQADPDVVITTNENQAGDLDNLQAMLGIPVIGLIYGDLSENLNLLWDGLNITAQILGTLDRFYQFKIYLEGLLDDLDERTRNISSVQNKTCYVGGISYRGGHGIDSTMPMFDSFVLVHANNVAQNISQDHAFIDPEQLLVWDPEIIFIDGGGFSLTQNDFKTGNFDTLQAVQNQNIYVLLPYNSYTVNFGSVLINTYYVGKVLYPTAFEDIDINTTAAEIYESFVGKNVLPDLMEMFQYYAKTTQNALEHYFIPENNSNRILGYPILLIGVIFMLIIPLLVLKSKIKWT